MTICLLSPPCKKEFDEDVFPVIVKSFPVFVNEINDDAKNNEEEKDYRNNNSQGLMPVCFLKAVEK